VNKQHISIIIPAYNEERYLGRCLDAIAAQIEKPYEVVVIDNGSADKTAEVAGQYSFVTVLSEPKKGRVFARNKGFMGATGELLARIDADAILPADWTQQVASYYTSPTALKTAWTSGPHFYNVRFPRTVSRIYSMLVFGANRFFAGHPTLWGSNMVLPKEIWRKVSDQVCLRNDIHEDLDLAIHVHRAGYQIVHKRQPTVRVQLRRVRSNRHELWNYLQWWPRTLRVHGLKTWPLCWLFGDVLIYCLTPIFGISERVARLFGRKPLSEDQL